MVAGVAILLGVIHFVLWKAKQEGRQECEQAHQLAAAADLQRHVEAVGEIANESQRLANRAAADRASVAPAAQRLRGAVAGSGLVVHPAAAASSPPAADTDV